jgi:hypothetical protein
MTEVSPPSPRQMYESLTVLLVVWQEDVCPLIMTEFDYIITKKKLEEDEDFKMFVNPHTKAEVRSPVLASHPRISQRSGWIGQSSHAGGGV